MSGQFRRNGKIWVRVFADLPITGKPTEVRMGRGKGNPISIEKLKHSIRKGFNRFIYKSMQGSRFFLYLLDSFFFLWNFLRILFFLYSMLKGACLMLPELPDLNELPQVPDLNATPSPEPEPEPGPEPEAPAPAEEELLIRNREKVKEDLRILLQIGYDRQTRRASAVEKIVGNFHLEGERNAAFLERLRDKIDQLCGQYNGSRGPRQKFDDTAVKALKEWIKWDKRENGRF
jgi:hypothetical protein